jgi:hypothetical protein
LSEREKPDISVSFYEALRIERRSCIRLTDSQLVMLCWEEHSATLKQLGNVANASSRGVGVLVDHSIPVGSIVTISSPSLSDFSISGVTRHLSRSSDGYFVGIEFASDAESQSPFAAA